MKTIVCFGNSITEGTPHVAQEDTFCRLLERRLNMRAACRERVVCINSGVGGENTAEGLARIDDTVLNHAPHLVVVEFGLNDIRYEPEKTIGPAEFADNLRTIHQHIAGAGAGVVFTTPNPIINACHPYSQGTDYYDRWGGCNGAVVEYAGIVREMAAELQAPLCDVYAAFERKAVELEFQGACGDYRDLTCLTGYINQEDGVHPTACGQELIAAGLYHTIVRGGMLDG